MTRQELDIYEFDLILNDCKFLYECFMECLHNQADAMICAGLFQYANIVVGEAYVYMLKEEILIGNEASSKLLNELVELRSKSIKMYSNATDRTIENLNDFAENEYLKFAEFNKKNSYTENQISNYFIAFLNDKPISNYFLVSNKIFNFSIGSYIKDITQQVEQYAEKYISLIVYVLNIFEHNELNFKPSMQLKFDVKYIDCNLNIRYEDLNINVTEILLSFLDIYCVINFYIYVVGIFKNNFISDLRFKYNILFNSIIGIKKILNYCNNKNIELLHMNDINEYIQKIENQSILKNNLRNLCSHYGCSEFIDYDDPVKDAFEHYFKMDIEQISRIFSDKLIQLSNLLDKVIFRYHI